MNFFKKKQNIIMLVIIAIIAVIVIGVGVKFHQSNDSLGTNSSVTEQENVQDSDDIELEDAKEIVYENGVLKVIVGSEDNTADVMEDENQSVTDNQIADASSNNQSSSSKDNNSSNTSSSGSKDSNVGNSNTGNNAENNSAENSNIGSSTTNSNTGNSNAGSSTGNSDTGNGNVGNNTESTGNSGSTNAGNSNGSFVDNTVTPPKEETITVTVTIRCDTILDNMANLKAGKEQFVPSSGYIMSKKSVTLEKGATAFEATKKACSNAGVQIEYSYEPIYGTYYVEGINNLYEFDCGDDSGWMYKVNGNFPNYGCAKYELKDGDKIVWCYTCNGLGADVGASY